jgi:amino acid adenylation domain-containing protein
VLDECDKVYEEEFGGSLLELLLTPAGTAEGVWPTETAQPALFAFELALARLWQSFGVQPALVVGHSVGEYAALCVAGALTLADGIRLTAQRGVLMQRGTVPGAMVAVRADADRVRELAQTPGVEIAAGNGPQSFVLTGSEVIVGQLAEQLDRLELKWQRLDVDRAFHSSLVDPILADFAKVVAQISLRPLRMPMVSSWSGELLESGTALDGDYLVGQLRQPVLFGDAVEALTAAGCRRFLELGPDAVLSPAGRRIAPNSTWIPTQRLGQDPVLATMNGLAELFEQGTEIAWAKVYPESGRVPLPTYPFRRVHHPVDASARPVPSVRPPVVEERSIERSGAALKRIPLDPPRSNGVVAPEAEVAESQSQEMSPFAIPDEDGDRRVAPALVEVPAERPVDDAPELLKSAYVQMLPGRSASDPAAAAVVAGAATEAQTASEPGTEVESETGDGVAVQAEAEPGFAIAAGAEPEASPDAKEAPADAEPAVALLENSYVRMLPGRSAVEPAAGRIAADAEPGIPAAVEIAAGLVENGYVRMLPGRSASDSAAAAVSVARAATEAPVAPVPAVPVTESGTAAEAGAGLFENGYVRMLPGRSASDSAAAAGNVVAATDAQAASASASAAEPASVSAPAPGSAAEVESEGGAEAQVAPESGAEAQAVPVSASEPEAEAQAVRVPASEPEAEAQAVPEAESPVGVVLVGERYREALEIVLDLTGEQLGLDPYDLTVDHTFAELGADSLSMLRVVEEVGQKFDVDLAVSELFDELNTPHKLASAVASRNLPDEVDPLDLVRTTTPDTVDPGPSANAANPASVEEVPDRLAPEENAVRDPRAALAVLGSGLADLAAKVDAAAAATSEAELPGSGMAALMSQQLRVAGQLVDGVTKLMHEQLALLNEASQNSAPEPAVQKTPVPSNAQAKVEKAEAEKAKRARDLEYWQTALNGAQPLVLPTDRPRPAADDEIATTVHELDSELGDAVFAFSRDRRVSPLMTMLAAVGTVLGRFAAQDDITLGTAALRRPGDTTTQPPLPLRIDLSGEPDLGDLAQRVRETTTVAFDHGSTDLAVLEQDPLFQVLVEFEAGEDDLAPGLDLRFRLAYHGDGITCTADYRASLFNASTIKRLLDYLEAVLRRAIAEPRHSLPELMLPIESDQRILGEFEGDAAQAGPVGRVRRDAVVAGELSGLHTLFEQQVARTPDAVALIQGERELTYAELDRRSNSVAWQLVDLGVKPGQLVAVRVARGAELVVAVLAVLKSGAAYLPLDPGVPESRWLFMTADAGAVALVGDDAALADRLGLRLVPVVAAEGDPRAKQAPPVRAAADDIAYCIYTSGSNGNPKGVAVPHRGPVNLIRHYLRTRRSLRTLQWTSFGFDVHVQEMFTALASGAALVLIGEDDRYDPDAVVAALKDHGVERLFMAFTPLTALLATMRKLPELPALREIVAGGEAMVLTHKIRDFLEAHPECTLYNEYGPTEASVVTTIHQVDPDEDRPSIGRPIDGVVVRLLDEALRPVPVGAIGEIHLGGVAVAHGYLGRPDETETAFVSDPAHPGGRLYRSRDLGRWRSDGALDYLGRADDQVKIRGHRVEPGETEHVLADLPGVIDAVVVACADPAGDTCLIGYVVLEDSDPAVLAQLLLDLTKELPIYLVPADLIPVEDLPLDDSGKLDRSRLPDPEWLKG